MKLIIFTASSKNFLSKTVFVVLLLSFFLFSVSNSEEYNDF